MKKIPFLTFVAVIIIAASICILSGFCKEIMAGAIVGFICGLAPAVAIISQRDADIGEIMKIGAVIGLILAVVIVIALYDAPGFGDKHMMGVAIFGFIGSVLGSIVGCMYKK